MWPYACFVSFGCAVLGVILSVPVEKKKSVVTEENFYVLTGLGSDCAPFKPRLLKGWAA